MTPRRLHRGSAITAISKAGTLVWLRVEKVDRNRIDTLYDRSVKQTTKFLDRFANDFIFIQFPLLVSSEGFTWCRGHVTEHHEAAASMLAASAMK